MAEKKLSTVVEQMLTCAFCLQEVDDPRCLLCQHTFCYTCLQKYVDKQTEKEEIPCPMCRHNCPIPQPNLDDLPVNYFFNQLKDAQNKTETVDDLQNDDDRPPSCSSDGCHAKASVYCERCDFLCEECDKSHNSLALTRKHRVKPVTADTQVSFLMRLPPCPKHQHQVLDLYCEDCKVPICSTCFALVHAKHSCSELLAKVDICKRELRDILKKADNRLKDVKARILITDQRRTRIKNDVRHVRMKILESYQRLYQKLRQEEREMHQTLDEVDRQADKQVKASADSQQTVQAGLVGLQLCGNQLLTHGRPCDFLTSVPSLRQRLEYEISCITQPLDCEVTMEEKTYNRKLTDVNLVYYDAHSRGQLERKGEFLTEQKYVDDLAMLSSGDICVVYNAQHKVQIYSSDGNVIHQMEVEGMKNPVGICVLAPDENTEQLVIADHGSRCIWLTNLIKRTDYTGLSPPTKHPVNYMPFSIMAVDETTVLVCDTNNSCMKVYDIPSMKLLNTIQLSSKIKPVQALPEPSGGYIIKHGNDIFSGELVWINTQGVECRRYTTHPTVSPRQIARDDKCWLVADERHKCVHVMQQNGSHCGYLLPPGDFGRITCVHAADYRVLVGCQGKDGKWRIVVFERPQLGPKLTLSATIFK